MKKSLVLISCLYVAAFLVNTAPERFFPFRSWSYILILSLIYFTFLAFIGKFKRKGVIHLFQTNFSIKTELLLFGLIGSIAIILIGYSLQYYSAYLNPDLGIKPPQRFDLIYFVFYVISAAFEELFSRKYVITEFSKKLSLTKTIRLSALAFALVHLPLEGGLLQYFFGLLLGYIFWITKDWFMCFLLHVLYNSVIGIVNELILSGIPLLSYDAWVYYILFIIGCVMLLYAIRKLKTKAKMSVMS